MKKAERSAIVQAQKELKESEERYRILTESAGDSIFLLNNRYEIQYLNTHASNQFRASKNELIGKPITSLFPPERARLFKQSIDTVFRTAEPYFSEEKVPFPDSERWLNTTLMPIRDDAGKVTGVMGVSRDVTIYKTAEEERDRFFNLNLDLLCIAGTDGYFKRINPTWSQVLGFTEEELKAAPFVDFIHPDDVEPTLEAVKQLSEQHPVINFVNRYRCKDGTYRWLSWASTPHGDQIYAAAHDITEQQEAEHSLIASQEKLSKEKEYADHLIDSLPGLFYQINTEGRFTHWNKNFEKVSQYSSKELAKMSPLDLFEGEDKVLIETRIRNVFEKGQDTAEALFVSKKGKKTPYSFTGKRIFVDGIPFLAGMGMDISSVKESEVRLSRLNQELVENKQFIETILDTSPDLIYIYDIVEQKNVFVNEGITRILGYPEQEIKKMGNELISRLMNPDDFSNYLTNILPAYTSLKDGDLLKHQYRMCHKDGDWRWLDCKELIFKRQKDGTPQQIFGVVEDITDRKIAEAKLEESEEKFRLAFDNAAIGKAMANIEGKFIKVSPALCRMLGYTEQELIEKTWMDITHPDFLEVSFQESEKLMKGESPSFTIDCKFLRKDKTTVWVNLNVVLAKDVTGNPMLLIGDMVNISERKRITGELNYRNDIIRKFLTTSDEEMFHGVLEIILNAMESPYGVFGYMDANGDLVVPSMTRHIWDECNVPEKDIRFPKETWGESAWPTAIREKQSNFSNQPSDLTPEGHITVTRHATTPIIHHERVIGLLQVANKSTDYLQSDVDLLETLANNIAPILAARMERNQEENHRNIAERALEEKVIELERSNKELEQFAYVASHDLQEPLRMVSSYTQLLEKRYKDKLDEDAHDFINFAVDGANRMQRLINDLLDFSRVTTRGNPFKKLDLSSLLGQVIANLQEKIGETGTVILNDDLPFVKGDESQLIRLFQNLIDNAIKFKAGGTPRIHIKATTQDKLVTVSVEDNGIGIDEAYADRIFTIFQRLHSKDQYPGTGIGLAICKRIVERHGGTIWYTSEEGKGTTFWFTLKQ